MLTGGAGESMAVRQVEYSLAQTATQSDRCGSASCRCPMSTWICWQWGHRPALQH